MFCILKVYCSNVLVVFPFPAPSHSILGMELSKTISRRHNVTFVTPFIPNEHLNNVTTIVVSEIGAHVQAGKINTYRANLVFIIR